ncbi:MAG: NAD(P)-dependent oxidoreductase [Syntrophorhabdales bacterium]
MILITGGGGFLGVNIAHALLDKGQEVLLLQRHPIEPPPFLAPFWGKQARFATGNVLDLPFLLGLAKEYHVDSIIHGAFDNDSLLNREGPMTAHLYQFVQVPVQGCINLMEVARLYNIRRLTLISSLVAYTGAPGEGGQWREDALLPPVSFSPIGNLKKAVEQICFLYSSTYGLSFVSLRVGWAYGPGSSSYNPVTSMLENTLAGRAANLPVPEDFATPMIYAKDVGLLAATIHLAKSLDHQIYNVAAKGNPSLLDVAKLVKRLMPEADISLGPPQPDQGPLQRASIERAEEEFAFAPLDLEAGIKAFIEWIREEKY